MYKTIDIIKLCDIIGLYINGYSYTDLYNIGYTTSQYHLTKLKLNRDRSTASKLGWTKDDGTRKGIIINSLPDWNVIPHPKGMLGKHHTEETKKKISKKGPLHPMWKGGTSQNHFRDYNWDKIRLDIYK